MHKTLNSDECCLYGIPLTHMQLAILQFTLSIYIWFDDQFLLHFPSLVA